MSPVTHFLCGWAVANAVPLSPRERAAVTLASLAPDVDGLGLIAEALTRHTAHPLLWWTNYHHVFGHNAAFALVVAAAVFAVSRQRWKTALLAWLSLHLHFVCDLVGARGPGGDFWPVPYLWPFSDAWTWAWAGQWKLNSWQNLLITAMVLSLSLYWAWKRGYSPLEMISGRADRAVVEALRRRFG
jgi:hypothetical protein